MNNIYNDLKTIISMLNL